MKRKIKKLYEKQDGLIVELAGFIVTGVAIGIVGYITGEAFTTLKIGRGLATMHEENTVHLVDAVEDRLIEDIREFQCITRYARSKKMLKN